MKTAGYATRTSRSLHPDRVTREILLSFWKVHILHHAEEMPIYGQWIVEELRHHGYRISPGTLYPLLKRMEENGWIKSTTSQKSFVRGRKEYRLTREGSRILSFLRVQLEELYGEVVREARGRRRSVVREGRARNPRGR
jgi:PadR family transcriptional regulator PadR